MLYGGSAMRSNKKWFLVLSLIFAHMLTSCATSSLTTVWKDTGYRDQISSVLIIGISKKPAKKRSFEDEFVRQMEAYGVRAVASYKHLPSEEMLQKDAIVSKVTEMNIDAVLITRLVARKTVESYVQGSNYYRPPSHYNGWNSYYSRSYNQGYVIKDEVVVLETNLYDTATEQIIWSAMSETFKGGSETVLIKDFIKLLVKNMSENKLLK